MCWFRFPTKWRASLPTAATTQSDPRFTNLGPVETAQPRALQSVKCQPDEVRKFKQKKRRRSDLQRGRWSEWRPESQLRENQR